MSSVLVWLAKTLQLLTVVLSEARAGYGVENLHL